jgi:DNA polymerase-1
MQQRGITIEQQELKRVRARVHLECTYLQTKLDQTLGYPINVRSTGDLRTLLYSVLSLKQLKTTKRGAASTDEETLLNLAYNSPHADLFKLILAVREKRTLLSSFLQMEVPADGRYRAVYKVHGTDSGRLASQSPYQTRGTRGPQLQNVPKYTRQLFVSTPGHILVQGDLRRAEAMFVGYDSGDPFLMELFADSTRDLYREVAARALSIPLADIETWHRELFKRVVHGSNYRMGAGRFVKVLRMAGINIEDLTIKGIKAPTKKAEYIQEMYFQVAKNIRPWQNEIERRARATRVLHDAFGRRRFFMGSFRDPHTSMVAISYRPQASIVSITNQALQRMTDAGWDVLLQVHDSLVVECSIERLHECALAMQRAFQNPMRLVGGECLIPLDIQCGPSWGEQKAYDGLVA